MFKKVGILVVLCCLVLAVTNAKATIDNHSLSNVMCNDGTISPTCQTCTRGCCSSHGGC